MEIVESDQFIVESASGASIAGGDIFSDASLSLLIEEFELLEMFEDD